MAANDQLDQATSVKTERLANQAQPSSALVSQLSTAQVDHNEIVQVVTANSVTSVAGTANQVLVNGATAAVQGAATLSLPASPSVTTSYKVNGTQVVQARETGWTAGTGTANKGAYATYAGQTTSAAYVQAEAQATDDAAKANSQRIKALEDSMRTHGLIN